MQRNLVIDFMKLVFVLCIFAGHINSLALRDEHIRPIMRLGFLGVEFFFIVSGYLMSMKIDKLAVGKAVDKVTFDFLYRKISIFYPYYITAYIMGFIVLHCKNTLDINVIIKHFIMSLPCLLQLSMAGISGYQVLAPTWFLSAMLISMLILFPLFYHYRDSSMLISTLLIIFLYGYIFHFKGILATIEPINNAIMYSGVLRGLAGISLGGICYRLCTKLKKQELTYFSRVMLTIIEISGYILIVSLMNYSCSIRLDFLILFLLTICIIISFSQKSYSTILEKYIPNKVGKLSMVIFFTDAIARNIVSIILPNSIRNEKIMPCFIVLFLLSFLILFIGEKVNNGVTKIKFTKK